MWRRRARNKKKYFEAEPFKWATNDESLGTISVCLPWWKFPRKNICMHLPQKCSCTYIPLALLTCQVCPWNRSRYHSVRRSTYSHCQKNAGHWWLPHGWVAAGHPWPCWQAKCLRSEQESSSPCFLWFKNHSVQVRICCVMFVLCIRHKEQVKPAVATNVFKRKMLIAAHFLQENPVALR